MKKVIWIAALVFYALLAGVLYAILRANRKRGERHHQLLLPLVALALSLASVIVGRRIVLSTADSIIGACLDFLYNTFRIDWRHVQMVCVDNIGFILLLIEPLAALIVFLLFKVTGKGLGFLARLLRPGKRGAAWTREHVDELSRAPEIKRSEQARLLIAPGYERARTGETILKPAADGIGRYCIGIGLTFVGLAVLEVLCACALLTWFPAYVARVSLLPPGLPGCALLFLELGYYLGGDLRIRDRESARAEEARVEADDKALFADFKNAPSLLCAFDPLGARRAEPLFAEYGLKNLKTHAARALCEAMREDNRHKGYPQIADVLLCDAGDGKGRSLLLEGAFFARYADWLFTPLVTMLCQGRKLLLLCEDKDASRGWMDEGLRAVCQGLPLFSVACLGDAGELPDVLIASPAALREASSIEDRQLLARYGCVMLLGGVEMLQGERLYLCMLFTQMALEQRERLQFIALSGRYLDGEGFLQNLLGQDFTAVTLFDHAKESRLLVHAEERMSGALYAPRLLCGVFRAHHTEHAPVLFYPRAEQKALAGNAPLAYSGRGFLLPITDCARPVARDSLYNLPLLVTGLLGQGVTRELVSVISPPYLLRDYFLHNLRMFVADPELCAKPLSVNVPRSGRAQRAYLAACLYRHEVSESELLDLLNKAGYCGQDVQTAFDAFAKDAFDSRVHLTMRKVRTIGDSGFDIKCFYRLTDVDGDLLTTLLSKLSRPVRMQVGMDARPGALLELPSDKFFQNHLPGQLFLANDSLYRFEDAHDNGQCLIVHASTAEDSASNIPYYKQQRVITIDGFVPGSESSRRTRSGGRVTLGILNNARMNARVDTPSYYQLDSASLTLAQASREDLSVARRELVLREYKDTPAAVFTLGGDIVTNADMPLRARAAECLALIVGLSLPTLLQKNEQYALCRALLTQDEADALPELAGGQGCLRALYAPLVDAEAGNGVLMDTLRVLIFEDAGMETGLLPALIKHWDDILRLARDYLVWLTEDIQARGEFLRSGDNTLAPGTEAALELLRDALLAAYPEGRNAAARTDAAILCEHCDSVLDDEHYEQVLMGGSASCAACAGDTLQAHGELKALCADARRFLAKKCALRLPRVKAQKPGDAGDKGNMRVLAGAESLDIPQSYPRWRVACELIRWLTDIWQAKYLRAPNDAREREAFAAQGWHYALMFLSEYGYAQQAETLRRKLEDSALTIAGIHAMETQNLRKIAGAMRKQYKK